MVNHVVKMYCRTNFTNLYLLEKRNEAFVADNLITGGRVVWDFHFYRDMTEGEAADFTHMIGSFDNVCHW